MNAERSGPGSRWLSGLSFVRRAVSLPLLIATLGLSPAALVGQVRPLHPLDWSLFESDVTFSSSVGMGLYEGQKASLAGIEGQLVEAGIFNVGWREGRLAVVAFGSVVQSIREERALRDPAPGTRGPDGGRRTDFGTFALSAIGALSEPGSPVQWLVRFGVRLPNADNRVGLGRDQTDFFATVGSEFRTERLQFQLEAGVAVLGTRSEEVEQVDPILFMGSVRWPEGPVRPFLGYYAQLDPRSSGPFRGTEDVQELNGGVRMGHDRWLDIEGVMGLSSFSPDYGVRIVVGIVR